MKLYWSKAVVLNWGDFDPQGTWHWLDTFLVVTNGGLLLASSG